MTPVDQSKFARKGIGSGSGVCPWGNPAGAPEPMSVARAHQMHRRMLAQWAMDVLALRRRGLDRPGIGTGPIERRAA